MRARDRPWSYPGLPPGLTPQHFEAAATAWVTHERQRVGNSEIRPLLGPGGAYFNLAGMRYEGTAARVAALMKVQPLLRLSDGRAVYPVLLIHDPSPGGDATPVGACAVTGYIGSAWNAHGGVAALLGHRPTPWSPWATVAIVTPQDYGNIGRLWLPTPDSR